MRDKRDTLPAYRVTALCMTSVKARVSEVPVTTKITPHGDDADGCCVCNVDGCCFA